MITNYENKSIDIKLNTDLRGLKPGTTLKIKVDKEGTPLERYWRDRFKDAKVDNCIEVLAKKKKAKQTKKDGG